MRSSENSAGGSNRVESYVSIARPPDFHYEICRIFRMRKLWRANLRDRRENAGDCLIFDAQMNTSALGQRQRLKRPKCTLTKDSIDVSDHEEILTNTRIPCIGISNNNVS